MQDPRELPYGRLAQYEADRVRFGSVLAYFTAGNFKIEKFEISQMTVAVDNMDHVKQTAEILRATRAGARKDRANRG